jgi:hypothetical protein
LPEFPRLAAVPGQRRDQAGAVFLTEINWDQAGCNQFLAVAASGNCLKIGQN